MTNPYKFDDLIDRTNTSSMKWDKYQGRDIIPLWVADMDFKSPPAVIDALHRRIDHGVFGYTFPPMELTDEVILMLRKKYGWKVEPGWISWLPGLVTGINVTCRAVGNDNDDILTTVPAYPPFLTAPAFSRRNLITVPLSKSSTGYTFDFDKIQKAITPNTRLFILCNPYNPVGRIFRKDELLRLHEICRDNKIIICSDEIHCDLLLDQDKPHIPIARLSSDAAKRTITLMAPSKTYNLPGLGCSFAVIPDPGVKARFEKAQAGIVPHINPLGYTAALSAYRECSEWLAALLDYLRVNRDMVTERINHIDGLSMDHVETTYLAWIDTRQSGLEDPTDFF